MLLDGVGHGSVGFRCTPAGNLRSAVADQFRFACIPATINGIPASSCRAVGQYGGLVSVFVTNVFDDQWFTWEDMEHVLQVIDERMAVDMQQH